MSKKFYSIVVVIITIIYLCVMLYINKDYIMENYTVKEISFFQNIKSYNLKNFFNKKNADNEVGQEEKVNKPTEKIITGSPLPKSIRKFKLDRAHKREEEILTLLKENTDNILSHNISTSSGVITEEKGEKNEEKVSAFNANTERKKTRLSSSDKEKILTIAKSLSPIDERKIEEYVENSDNADVMAALDLFKKRLSDKEYEKLKSLEETYIK